MTSVESRAFAEFSVPSVDIVRDLHGDPCDPDLVLFFNGNQWMVLEELLAAFRAAHPRIRWIFYETLPPGVLAEQIRRGGLRMEELIVTTPPDVFTAGREEMEALLREGFVRDYRPYARNGLAILVPAANPAGVRGLGDLGRPGIRVVMPNPAREGVGRLIMEALRKAGGEGLVRRVMEEKVARGETYLTHIHHRETIDLLRGGLMDAGPVWLSEALYQRKAGAPLGLVAIPPEHDVIGWYFIARVDKAGRHSAAAEAFIEFMAGGRSRRIYADYGFLPPA